MTCRCHPRHHHTRGTCRTVTISGPPTPQAYYGAAAELHIGRTINRCGCWLQPQQPATGEQVEKEVTNKERSSHA